MSPQDDHVIEFAKQFGWDSTWMEKQAKKKSKKKLEEEAARFSQDVGEMLGAVTRDAASSASASQVVPRDQSSSGAVLPTQAPQVKAPPPVKANPPAPPSSVEPLPLAGASPQATPPEFSTPPPPPRRRRARSEETEVASREDRLAVIARTAQSKAMAVPVRDANVDGSHESRDVEIQGTEGHEAEDRELKTCVICFEVCDPSDGEYPLEALPCAHVFHVACLAAWRETVRISDRSRCPNGCHRAHGHPFFRSFGQPSQVPRDDDPDDANATEAADSPEALMSPGEVAFL